MSMHAPSRNVQSGYALLLLVFLVLAVIAAGLLPAVQRIPANRAAAEQAQTSQALLQARQALLAWAMTAPNAVPPGLLPYPDRNNDGNYDGRVDCPPDNSIVNNALRIGQFPALGEDTLEPNNPCESQDAGEPRNGLGTAWRDGSGAVLWYAASANVLDNTLAGEYPALSTALLAGPPNANWLTVCDENGQRLTNEAAFVLIGPGAALTGQNRSGAAAARGQFLEGRSLAVAGAVPGCNSATESNADGNNTFIQASATTSFNDQLLFVTRQEWMGAATIGVANQVFRALEQYRTVNGSYPWASGNPLAQCDNNLVNGRLPLDNGAGCTGLAVAPPFLDASDPQNWYAQITYSRTGPLQATLTLAACGLNFAIVPGRMTRLPANQSTC